MFRLLKRLVLAFKPISDAEALQMNLSGPKPPRRKKTSIWKEVDKLFKGPNSGIT